jgi:hypothetical protein
LREIAGILNLFSIMDIKLPEQDKKIAFRMFNLLRHPECMGRNG